MSKLKSMTHCGMCFEGDNPNTYIKSNWKVYAFDNWQPRPQESVIIERIPEKRNAGSRNNMK